MATLDCVLQADSERNKGQYICESHNLTTSNTISDSAHHLSCPKIRSNVSALNQRHTNLTSQDLFNAAWTHIHLKNIRVLLDGCFSPFVISIKYINHHGKIISSHLIADTCGYERNFLIYFIEHALKEKRIVHYLAAMTCLSLHILPNVILWSLIWH